MKSVKFLFVFAYMAISLFFANAQVVSNFNEMSFFKAKFTKDKVWDAQRSPVYPVAGTDWTLKGLKVALDASNAPIAWGAGRYLMFVAGVDNANSPNSLVDNVNNSGKKYTISLKLFESNGTLVKVISTWGGLIGQGDKGFMYEMEGKYGAFFSVTDLNASSVVTYKPSLAKVSKMSEIISSSELTKVNTNLMHSGTVISFNALKGFGFIKDGSSGIEYFVHVSGLKDEVNENDQVTFYLQESKRGLNAVNVKLK
jgi:CspA family cold shock protein